MKKVVIIGAGYAGVLTAQHLAKKLENTSDVRITLIDKNNYHTMRTEIHAAATSRGKANSIIYDLKDIFKKTNVNLIFDTAIDIDFENKKVKCKNGEYEYDYLTISAGSQPTYFGIPGAEEFAKPFWTYDDAVALKAHFHDVFKRASQETDVNTRKQLLTFHIVGAGLTGIELAGEVGEYIPMLCKKYKVNPSDVTVVNLDAMPRAIPNFPEKLSNRAAEILGGLGIKMLFNTKVLSVKKDSIELETNGVASTVPTGTVIWSAGITANAITQKAAEHLSAERGFRIKDDPQLKSETDKSVFVVGDNMFYIPKGKKSTVPQMVENCEQASKIVANNIAYLVTGNGKEKVYKPSLHGAMISLGAKQGIGYVGIGNFMVVLPSLPTQVFKRAVNIMYLAPVIGFDKIGSLVMHEFFAKRKIKY